VLPRLQAKSHQSLRLAQRRPTSGGEAELRSALRHCVYVADGPPTSTSIY
jgi:hypothetical protein